MGLSRDVSWPILFWVSCFLWCCSMHLMAQKMESTFYTGLVALSSISECFKQSPRWKLILSMSFCFVNDCALNITTKDTFQTVLKSSQWTVTILVLNELDWKVRAKQSTSVSYLWHLLQERWAELSSVYFYSSVERMPKIYEAVIAAKMSQKHKKTS